MTQNNQLIEKLTAAREAYYNSDKPLMTDTEYDNLSETLKEIDPNHPMLSEVGVAPSPSSKKVTHRIPMLSLNKVTKDGDLFKFVKKIGFPVVIESKLDGMSVELKYVNGRYTEASTRGDGVVGEDITDNIRKTGIPLNLGHDVTVEIRGEVVLSVGSFKKIGGKNPRNVGNGIMRRSDGRQCELLEFFAFDTTANEETEVGRLDWLISVGFKVVDAEVVHNLEDLIVHLADLGANRPKMSYAIDGAVLKPYRVFTTAALGVTGGRPVGQAAWKWEDEASTTTVKAIHLSCGHTGAILPTAELEPVEIEGTTVTSAYLNNWDDIARLNVNIGDEVEITKRNQIIPHIESVVTKNSVGFFPEPKTCPVCGSDTCRKTGVEGESGAITFCSNPYCEAKIVGKVKRWINSLDIKGIGDELLAVLAVNRPPLGPIVADPAGLYCLRPEMLAPLIVGNGRLGESRAADIVAEIKRTNRLSIDQFLGSLGVEFLGIRKVEQMRELAEGALDHVEQWTDAAHLMSLAAKCKVPNAMARISAGIQEVVPVILNLLDVMEVEEPIETALKDVKPVKSEESKTFTLTGKFEVPKAVIHQKISEAGHYWLPEFTKDTTHLVTASPDSTSSKAKRALKAGIPVITLAELEAML